MIRQISGSAMKLLQYTFNKIWCENPFLKVWSKAILLPFSKPQKNLIRFVDSYRPIALTSCLCKLLEKVTNSGLMYFVKRTHTLEEGVVGCTIYSFILLHFLLYLLRLALQHLAVVVRSMLQTR